MSDNLALPQSRRARALKKAIGIGIAILVLLVVIVGGAVAYIWYTGRNEPAPSAVPLSESSKPPTMSTPREPDEDAAFGASLQTTSPPAAPGENAAVTIKTRPRATCEISVTYDKIEGKDSGLKPKVADEYGVTGWSWTIPADAPKGKWPAKVTCTYGKRSAAVQADIIIIAATR